MLFYLKYYTIQTFWWGLLRCDHVDFHNILLVEHISALTMQFYTELRWIVGLFVRYIINAWIFSFIFCMDVSITPKLFQWFIIISTYLIIYLNFDISIAIHVAKRTLPWKDLQKSPQLFSQWYVNLNYNVRSQKPQQTWIKANSL